MKRLLTPPGYTEVYMGLTVFRLIPGEQWAAERKFICENLNVLQRFLAPHI